MEIIFEILLEFSKPEIKKASLHDNVFLEKKKKKSTRQF